MEELNSYALSDLELDASKAVIQCLEIEFGYRAGDHLTRSLTRFLESEVQDPIKAFTIACWIHSKVSAMHWSVAVLTKLKANIALGSHTICFVQS